MKEINISEDAGDVSLGFTAKVKKEKEKEEKRRSREEERSSKINIKVPCVIFTVQARCMIYSSRSCRLSHAGA